MLRPNIVEQGITYSPSPTNNPISTLSYWCLCVPYSLSSSPPRCRWPPSPPCRRPPSRSTWGRSCHLKYSVSTTGEQRSSNQEQTSWLLWEVCNHIPWQAFSSAWKGTTAWSRPPRTCCPHPPPCTPAAAASWAAPPLWFDCCRLYWENKCRN